jgi:DinB superfamily
VSNDYRGRRLPIKRAILSFCIAACPALGAENGGKTLVTELVSHWQASKKLSLAVAEALPADSYLPFKPSDTSWNFADEMGSLALTNVLLCSLATHTRAPQSFQAAFDRPMSHDKAETIRSLKTAYDYCIDGITAMNDAGLLETAVVAGHQETKLDIFWNALGHATHRLGQAEMYLRLKNIKPPETGPNYEF